MFKPDLTMEGDGAPAMILANAAALLLHLLGGEAGAAQPAAPGAQVTVRQRLIIRMPRNAVAVSSSSPAFTRWREGRGPRCVAMRAVAGATLLGDTSVDLVLADRSRVRAHLERGCGALDFYRGFYVNGTEDGMICADRDSIRSRMGGQCRIERFRSLTAVRP
jgi:hypothetical protein